MTALAASSSAKEWRRALDSYSAKIVMHATSAKRRAGLEALDRYVREDLPRTVGLKAQDEGGAYLTKEDLCKVVEWKITRGKFRPLMRHANALNPKEVRSLTSEALSCPVDEGMEKLTSLKGIGPATASAILSFAQLDGSCPFLSDEVMYAFGVVNKAGKLDYTLSSWQTIQKCCAAKAEELNEAIAAQEKAEQEEEEDNEQPWTPALVERAIWAATVGGD